LIYLQPFLNKNRGKLMIDTTKNEYSHTSIRSLISTIALIVCIIIYLFESCSANNNENSSDTDIISKDNTTVACSHCGKIIREDGINTHCQTVNSDEVLKCDYCKSLTYLDD